MSKIRYFNSLIKSYCQQIHNAILNNEKIDNRENLL